MPSVHTLAARLRTKPRPGDLVCVLCWLAYVSTGIAASVYLVEGVVLLEVDFLLAAVPAYLISLVFLYLLRFNNRNRGTENTS